MFNQSLKNRGRLSRRRIISSADGGEGRPYWFPPGMRERPCAAEQNSTTACSRLLPVAARGGLQPAAAARKGARHEQVFPCFTRSVGGAPACWFRAGQIGRA